MQMRPKKGKAPVGGTTEALDEATHYHEESIMSYFITDAAERQLPQSIDNLRLQIVVRKLAEACEKSRQTKDPAFRSAMESIVAIDIEPLRQDLLRLYEATRIFTAWRDSFHTREIGTHARFREKFAVLLPESTLLEDPPRNSRHVPDDWVLMDGLATPVEVKREVFDAAALKQLQRYMRVFGAIRGVAVAPRLSVNLPDSVIFVQVK